MGEGLDGADRAMLSRSLPARRLEDATIAVLVPAHDEEKQIVGVLRGIPDFVDHIVVVDDASGDATAEVVRGVAADDPRITLISLEENRGVGGALAVGYRWAVEHDVDVAVTLDGDGQMDPAEMEHLIRPILDGRADYTKGNRLHNPGGWDGIPRLRLFGNAVLSVLTKIASGYWGVADSQSGYTAAGRYALDNIPWDEVYPRYGRPNDVLVLANAAECRVADVPVRPIYGVGENSGMSILKVTFSISWLLVRRFWWRMFHRYVLRDFHPLVFFYLLATVASLITIGLTVRLFWLWPVLGEVPQMTALALAFFGITALNTVFFAFWMDMEANRHLAVTVQERDDLLIVSSAGGSVATHTASTVEQRDAADQRPVDRHVQQSGD